MPEPWSDEPTIWFGDELEPLVTIHLRREPVSQGADGRKRSALRSLGVRFLSLRIHVKTVGPSGPRETYRGQAGLAPPSYRGPHHRGRGQQRWTTSRMPSHPPPVMTFCRFQSQILRASVGARTWIRAQTADFLPPIRRY